jgi:ribonuclease HI
MSLFSLFGHSAQSGSAQSDSAKPISSPQSSEQHKAMMWIFTDGACSGNPGPGGWAALICDDQQTLELSGRENSTTNNRMEMLAVISALEWVQNNRVQGPMTIASDSQYVIKGITLWIGGWMRNGWKTSAKKPVENQDLWQRMWDLSKTHSGITWQWVRGHNGHPENERVDALARMAVRR